jgi:hypothetical protein
MNRLIAILFLLIFSLQVLPVRTMGKLLGKKAQTEEVKDDCDDSGDDDTFDPEQQKYNNLLHYHTLTFSVTPYSKKKNRQVIHVNDDLPNSHIEEILSPPPDC